MQEAELIHAFVEPLNRSGLTYMVTGSIAVIVMGEPRLTHDVDIVIRLGHDDCARLPSIFPEDRYYCPPLETIRLEAARETRGHFNLIHLPTGGKADLYPVGKDPLHLWALLRRLKVDCHGATIFLAPPEYVVVRKLQYYVEGRSQKHLQDIAQVLKGVAETIDRPALHEWIDRLGLQHVWREIETNGLSQELP